MESIMQNISWVFVALSLIGNYFVVKKNVLGQWIWATSNVGWVIFDLYIGAWSQAFLFSTYLCLCVWGIISWTKEAKQAKASS